MDWRMPGMDGLQASRHIKSDETLNHQPAIVLVTQANRWAEDRSRIEFRGAHLRHLAPAGRLDIDSIGLLVLTQDGRVARQLIGEDSTMEKEYLVRVEGALDARELALLNHGLERARDADTVAAHDSRLARSGFIEEVRAEFLAVFRAELEDVADLDPAGGLERRARAGGAVALARAAQVGEDGRREVAAGARVRSLARAGCAGATRSVPPLRRRHHVLAGGRPGEAG